MHTYFGRLAGLFLAASISAPAFAEVFEISANGISDHGNPYIAGSIAQWFAHGKRDHIYVLTSKSEQYQLKHSLRLPEGATLTSSSGAKARLIAAGNIEHMIELSNGVQIKSLVIDADDTAYSGIYGRNSNDVRVSQNEIRNTRSSLNSQQCQEDEIRTHLVSIWDSTGVKVDNNLLENSGLPAIGNPQSSCAVKSNSLSIKNNSHVEIANNTIRNSASGGIDITDSIYMTIKFNRIDGSGANRKFYGHTDTAKASDGIVGYANPLRPAITNFYRIIHNNTITNWGNHAIHVSGRMHSIRNNKILWPTFEQGRGGHGIYVGDRDNHIGGIQCSGYIWIEGNTIQSANEAVVVDYYNSSTLWRGGNTVRSGGTTIRNSGCTGAEWR